MSIRQSSNRKHGKIVAAYLNDLSLFHSPRLRRDTIIHRRVSRSRTMAPRESRSLIKSGSLPMTVASSGGVLPPVNFVVRINTFIEETSANVDGAKLGGEM